jgi:uncharacterized protein YgbK (DUF1537 family)
MTVTALAMTMADAAAMALAAGPGWRIGRGVAGADCTAPGGLTLARDEAAAALRGAAGPVLLGFGNQDAAPDFERIGALMDDLIEGSGLGLMAASFAAPGLGRTAYQGHLFQDGRLLGNLRQLLTPVLSRRVAVIAHDVVTAGPRAIRARLTAAREQGASLAVMDAINPADCSAIAAACESQLLAGGPAWLTQDGGGGVPAALTGKLVILAGAVDRQSLFQLAAARAAMPCLDLDFAASDLAAGAITWALAQTGPCIIAAAAPPDRMRPGAPVGDMLGEIARGLAAAGTTRFVITGNDSAVHVLSALGIHTLTAGASAAGLRWLGAGDYNFLLKPGGFGARDLLLDGFEPQIRRNAAAE